jgi:pantetheine-phosphate adenylyltransferase, bacterial
MLAIVPGSFDSITFGHLDIIKRTATLYDKVIVVVMNNAKKNSLFTAEEKVKLINESIKDLGFDNIEVTSYLGLLSDFVKSQETEKKIVVKGLRTVSDYEYEVQMVLLNKDLSTETSFVITSPEYSHVSSSMVKELVGYDGDASNYAPKEVIKAVKDKIKYLSNIDI